LYSTALKWIYAALSELHHRFMDNIDEIIINYSAYAREFICAMSCGKIDFKPNGYLVPHLRDMD